MTLADDRTPIPAFTKLTELPKLTAAWLAQGSAQFLADNCGHQTLAVLEQLQERLRVRIEDFFRPELKAIKANSYKKQGAN